MTEEKNTEKKELEVKLDDNPTEKEIERKEKNNGYCWRKNKTS